MDYTTYRNVNNILTEAEKQLLNSFIAFANSKGFEAAMVDNSVVIKNVSNHNNNYRIVKVDDYYAIYTICISPDDYEYTAKCMVYVLLAEFNKSNGTSTHLHINFRVDL